MPDALETLIRQAEEQKLLIELQIRLQNNLALFSERFPKIYDLIKDRTMSKAALQIDDNGRLNLIDIDNNCYMYDGDPVESCENQIEAFQKKSRVKRFRIAKAAEQNRRHFHIQGLNALIDEYNQQDVIRIKRTPNYLTNLLVSGIGLGHHLTNLIARFDIQNIFIYENCVDTFLASLHTIDWQPILDYFRQEQRTLTLCIGVKPNAALEKMRSLINSLGLHTQTYTFCLTHSTRPEYIEFSDKYHNEIQYATRGLGYFDDERIGIAHAHHNLMAEHSVFITPKRFNRNTPVLVVGNGPSLDIHEDFLLRNKDNAIIVSCGTALASLLRIGVTPDFHVEMERPAFVEQVVRLGTTDEQRKNITLLCLHTVSPKTIACFPECCYAIKPNDAGGSLVHDYFKPQKVVELAYCNPTVANCALSFFANMGFSYLHLIGIDLGVPEDSDHHSRKSIYFDIAKFANKDGKVRKIKKSSDVIREGNLGGSVVCSEVLDTSKVMMEELLAKILKVMPTFKCVNSNRGAKIQHTLSRNIEEIEDYPQCDKEISIKSIKSEHFYRKNNKSYKKDPVNTLSYFFSIRDNLKLPAHLENEKEAIIAANNIYKNIAKSKDPMSHFLLRGSLNCFIGSIVENSFYCKSKQDFKSRYAIGVKHYNKFIDNIYEAMKTDPFELDDTQSPVIQSIVKDRENHT